MKDSDEFTEQLVLQRPRVCVCDQSDLSSSPQKKGLIFECYQLIAFFFISPGIVLSNCREIHPERYYGHLLQHRLGHLVLLPGLDTS